MCVNESCVQHVLMLKPQNRLIVNYSQNDTYERLDNDVFYRYTVPAL